MRGGAPEAFATLRASRVGVEGAIVVGAIIIGANDGIRPWLWVGCCEATHPKPICDLSLMLDGGV